MEKLNLKRHVLRFVDIRPRGKMHLRDIRRGSQQRLDRHHVTFCGIEVPTEQYRTERTWGLQSTCEKCLHHLQHEYSGDFYSIEDSEG